MYKSSSPAVLTVPPEYGPWQRIYGLFRRWQRDGTWVSPRTVARAIEWLHADGYLGTVESGSTPLFRIGVLYGMDYNAPLSELVLKDGSADRVPVRLVLGAVDTHA